MDKCCALIDGQHEERCGQAPMLLTKQEFVEAVSNSARSAIQTRRDVIKYMGMRGKEATEQTISEVEEGAACFAEIGSCHGGGCKHS